MAPIITTRRRRRLGLPRAAAVLGTLLLALAACGGGAEDASGDDGGQETPETSGGDDTSGAGGSFSLGINEPDSLIPGRSGTAIDVLHALFAPLIRIDQDGELELVVASSIESDDATTWTITLNDGWSFHDGEPVTAASFVDAWNHTAYGPNAFENNLQLVGIAGYADLNPAEGEPSAETLSGLEIVDDLTFTVTLDRPNSQFPLVLSSGGAFLPLPSVAYEDFDAFNEAPIGNGPYAMDGAWDHDRMISVVRYEDYAGTPPLADGIEFPIYADLATAYREVQAGNLDIVALGQDSYARAAEEFGDRVVSFAAPAIDLLLLSTNDPRFDDVRVRQAFSMAIDRAGISEALFGGLLEPSTSMLAPTMDGGRRDICDACVHDPEAARELLAEAGGFEGELTIYYPSDGGAQSTFEAIGNQLQSNLGIEVAYDGSPFPEFLEYLIDHQTTGVYRGHWGSLYPSLQEPLEALFTPEGIASNAVLYSDDEVTATIAEGNAATDPADAVTFYQEAEDLILADLPAIPLFYSQYVYVHSERVDNVIIDINQVELGLVEVVG